MSKLFAILLASAFAVTTVTPVLAQADKKETPKADSKKADEKKADGKKADEKKADTKK
jgi:hypothetical protein